MGIYDRDYIRDEQPEGLFLGGQWSAVGKIVLLNVIVYLAVAFFPQYRLNDYLALNANLFAQLGADFANQHYWEGWRVLTLLTYGFAHSQVSMLHIVFNMFLLWMFGSEVEGIYGKRLFWQLYISLVLLSGLCWMATELLLLHNPFASAVGASGAVAGVLLLFFVHFPKRTVLLFFVLPMPAWVLGVLWLGQELLVAATVPTNIAHSAHFAGLFFGFVFYRWHWTLFSLLPMGWLANRPRRSRRAKLRVVRDEPEDDDQDNLDAEVDRILAKISRLGTDSLTDEEHHTLEVASRRAQRRRGVHMD